MSLDSELLDILVCPQSKEPLIYFADKNFLLCPESQLKYPIKDDIPQMLEEEAEEVTEEELERLQEEARENDLPVTAQNDTTE